MISSYCEHNWKDPIFKMVTIRYCRLILHPVFLEETISSLVVIKYLSIQTELSWVNHIPGLRFRIKNEIRVHFPKTCHRSGVWQLNMWGVRLWRNIKDRTRLREWQRWCAKRYSEFKTCAVAPAMQESILIFNFFSFQMME